MPFLPDSIRGEDYDVSKDESLNIMSFQNDNNQVKETPTNVSIMNIADMSDIIDMDVDSVINNQSYADLPLTYEDTVQNSAYVGSIPVNVIMEGIEGQFNDYINIEDTTNYVDVFYEQLHTSYKEASNDTETFQEDIIKILDTIQQTFIQKMGELFNTRLTLTIVDIEEDVTDSDDIEFIIRRLYEFFILGARNNFKVAIANDLKARSKVDISAEPRVYFKALRDSMVDYSPLITTFGPMEFLKYRGDQEIIQFFENGKVVGNFLRKYTPKLYQNEEFEVELINYITMREQVKAEVFNNDGN